MLPVSRLQPPEPPDQCPGTKPAGQGPRAALPAAVRNAQQHASRCPAPRLRRREAPDSQRRTKQPCSLLTLPSTSVRDDSHKPDTTQVESLTGAGKGSKCNPYKGILLPSFHKGPEVSLNTFMNLTLLQTGRPGPPRSHCHSAGPGSALAVITQLGQGGGVPGAC